MKVQLLSPFYYVRFKVEAIPFNNNIVVARVIHEGFSRLLEVHFVFDNPDLETEIRHHEFTTVDRCREIFNVTNNKLDWQGLKLLDPAIKSQLGIDLIYKMKDYRNSHKKTTN